MAELIPGLPEEIALECFTRLPYTAHPAAARVCRRWRKLLQSKDFYYHRKRTGNTHNAACLIQSFPVALPDSDGRKRTGSPVYGLSVFDPVSGAWELLESVPKYPNGLPLFCQAVSSEGRLVLMGGWNPENYDPVKDVFVYEFTTRRWRRGKDMPSKRSFFAAGEVDGRIYMAGGHDESKNALDSAWAYDVRKDEWTELGRMSQERDECEGVVVGTEFWVVSGYSTENQGRFERSAESLDPKKGEWRRVEEVWESSACPRSCVGVSKEGKLRSWAEWDDSVRIGACGVDLGERTFLSGSAYQGAPGGFYLVEKGKLERINVPDEFLGFVQLGCCVEI